MYHVYTTRNLIDSQFTEQKRLTPTSFRDEIGGLGVASLRLDGNDLNASIDGVWKNAADNVDENWILPGDWVFIIKDDTQWWETKTPIADKLDPRIVWWGYISSTSKDIAKLFKDQKGDVQCSQFGHWLALHTIFYTKEFDSGFNPQIDGWTLGNKDGTRLRKKDLSIRPIADAQTHFWKIREALDYIVSEGISLDMDVDYSLIDLTNSPLNLYETLPSYAGASLNTALEEILSPYGWRFIFISESAVTIQIIDKTAYGVNTNKKDYVIPDGIVNLTITGEEKKYDGVVLQGDRVLVNFSVTTFHPSDESIGIGPGWIRDEEIQYITPPGLSTTVYHISGSPSQLTYKGVTIATLKDYIDDYFTEELKEGQEENVQAAVKEAAVSNIFNDLETERRVKHRSVYQNYNWLYGSSSGEASAGEGFWTYERPGDYNPGNIIPVFPTITTQDLSKISAELYDSSFYPTPYITDVDASPAPSEYKFSDRLMVDKFEETYVQPTFYYRTTTPLLTKTIAGDPHYPPTWYEATLQRSNGISWSMTPTWRGVQIESPYPEALGCDEEDLFSDPYGTSDWLAPLYHYQTSSWDPTKNPNVTPSNYDPYYFQRNKYGIGTWQRMIFSLGAYSGQRLEVRMGAYSGERIKYVVDDNYKFIINRKGFVWDFKDKKTDDSGEELKPPYLGNWPVWTNSNLLTTFNNGNEVIWDDTPIMKINTKMLYDYYSKDKLAVRLECPIKNITGVEWVWGLKIGDFIRTIKDGSVQKNVNSYVASIEYMLEGAAPRIIIATEYPASPQRTRDKILRSRV